MSIDPPPPPPPTLPFVQDSHAGLERDNGQGPLREFQAPAPSTVYTLPGREQHLT